MWPARIVILFYVAFNLLIMLFLISQCRLSYKYAKTRIPCTTRELDDPAEVTFDPGVPFQINDPCNLQHLLSDSFTAEHLQLFQQHCDRVWYNRVMKSGSSFFVEMLMELAASPDFVVVDRSSHWYLSTEEQAMAAEALISNKYGASITHGHHFFVPFKKFNVPQPFIINLVRHPIPRTISHYFFQNYLFVGLKLDEGQNITDLHLKNLKGTLTDCALGRNPMQLCNAFFGYFCEDEKICSPKGPEALALAKKNVETYGIVVGLSEDLPEFCKVLELLSPVFFKGIHDKYLQKKIKHGDSHFSNNSNVQDLFQLNTREVMSLPFDLETEIDFYQFLKQRFYLIKNKLTRLREEIR